MAASRQLASADPEEEGGDGGFGGDVNRKEGLDLFQGLGGDRVLVAEEEAFRAMSGSRDGRAKGRQSTAANMQCACKSVPEEEVEILEEVSILALLREYELGLR